MLKPSYAQLMDVLNKGSKENVTSRYSVVIAAAKRARQLMTAMTNGIWLHRRYLYQQQLLKSKK